METRTKSANIEALITPATNTEISFSLSPQTITENYELGTASLEQKLNAIRELLSL